MGIGTFLSWIGGGISRTAATAVATGFVFVATGVMPWELVVALIESIPEWMTSGWFRFFLVVVGFTIIGVSLRWNLWSRQQKAIDDLAEDLSWAVHNLLNRHPRPSTDNEIGYWVTDYKEWCERVSEKLENRSFFTRADQLHFDRLGFLDPVFMSGNETYDWWLSQLRVKFERLRDVINWTQQRRR